MHIFEGWFCSAKLLDFPFFAIALFCTVQFWEYCVSSCVSVTCKNPKHFHMNTVVRQLLEQNTDVVMVDTGDSYEGICRYFKGTYITYSKEKPISMNPFKITDTEYAQNFGEKKNFLKSLIFLIFKGSEAPTKIEDKIINQTIVEYYESYFTPFKEFTDAERDQLRKRLLLEDKKNGTYEKHSKELEEKYKHTEYETDIPTSEDPSAFGGQDTEYGSINPADGSRMADDGPLHTAEEKEAYARIQRKVNKLHDLINDKAATDGEKVAANRQLMRLMPQLIEGNYLVTIEQRIDRMEKQRQKMHVDNLSFNSYYEFAIERIPQIMREKSINFDIDNFAAILEQFYKGGELEHTLNNDVDASLFDARTTPCCSPSSCSSSWTCSCRRCASRKAARHSSSRKRGKPSAHRPWQSISNTSIRRSESSTA